MTIKINIEIVDSQEEESLHLKVREMNKGVVELVNALKVEDEYIYANQENKIHRIHIDEKYQNYSFIRISKSVIVNVDKVHMISPITGGKFGVQLDNGEFLEISRNYIKDLKDKIGIS